jgi:predicted phage terminase large subunit-like protein
VFVLEAAYEADSWASPMDSGPDVGRGADLILIDDPLKPEEALSKARRDATNDWYANTLYSRLNDKRRGAIVIIMQRLHEDDLVGHVLGQEPWEVVCFPAIAEADEVHEIETVWGPQRFIRRQGEALHPARESLATLAHMRRTIGEYNFAGQYQQSPAPLGGGLVKAEWFKRYREKERSERFERIVQSWDTANKATELSDFSVCTTWGIRGKNLYLLGLLRQRLEYPALKRAVREQQNLFNATEVLIEDKASGTQLIQELIVDGCHGVTRYQPTIDKIVRLNAQTAMIENGFVYISETAPWLAEYLHEMTVFPNGKHDDQVDSTAQCPARASRLHRNRAAPHGRHCLVGAIEAVDGRQMLRRVVLQAAREVSGKRYWRIESFNDDPRTTHADVLEVLRHARENIIAGMIGDPQPWHQRCLRAIRAFLGPASDHGTVAHSPEREYEPHMGQTWAPCRDPEDCLPSRRAREAPRVAVLELQD